MCQAVVTFLNTFVRPCMQYARRVSHRRQFPFELRLPVSNSHQTQIGIIITRPLFPWLKRLGFLHGGCSVINSPLLSFMLTVAVSLMYSPRLSRPGMRAGLSGVKINKIRSSYSSLILSSTVSRRMSALLETRIGCCVTKSELPSKKTYIYIYIAIC